MHFGPEDTPRHDQEPVPTQTERFADIDQQVVTKLHEVLGITPSNVRLFIRTGNHVLDKNHLDFIAENAITHVAGERDVEGLLQAYKDAQKPEKITVKVLWSRVVEAVFQPGIGSSPIAEQTDNAAVKSLIDSNVRMTALDGDSQAIFDLWRVGRPESIVALGSASVAGLVLVLTGVSIEKYRQDKISKRLFLALAGGSTLALGAAVAVPSLMPNVSHSIIDSRVIETQVMYDRLRAGRSDERLTIFGSFNELLLRRRNEIMALNLWNVLSRAKDISGGETESIFSYFGKAHSEIIGLFLEGPQEAERLVRDFARLLLTEGMNFLITQSQTDATVRIQDSLLEWFTAFADATTVGPQHSLRPETIGAAIPTARTVFIDVLLEQIAIELLYTNTMPNERFTRLSRLLEAIQNYIEKENRDTISELQHITRGNVGSSAEALSIPLDAETEDKLLDTVVFGNHDVRLFLQQSATQRGTIGSGGRHDAEIASQKTTEILTGLCTYGGQYHICKLRMYRTLSNSIVTKYELQLADGHKYYFNRREYVKSDALPAGHASSDKRYIHEVALAPHRGARYTQRMDVVLSNRRPDAFLSTSQVYFESSPSNPHDPFPIDMLSMDTHMLELITDYE